MAGELRQAVEGFLAAGEFRLFRHGHPDCVIGQKAVTLHNDVTWLVFVVPEDAKAPDIESRLLDRIDAVRDEFPGETAFLVAQSTGGFTKEFRQELKARRVQFQVPVQFFDASYKREELSAKAVGQIRLASVASSAGRVRQPFVRIDRGRTEVGEDLYEHLRRALASGKPAVRFIVGRAGIGKSVLFSTLFADEQAAFLDAKSQQRLRPRPIPFQPEHTRGLLAARTELLVENMLRTDLAAPVTRNQFEWMLVNGFTSWFMDGLDEIYAGDPAFFLYLEDLLTRPGGKASLNIFCRDSLTSAVDAFAEFQELAGDMLEVYRLEPWERESKRAFAWYRAAERPPRHGENDPPEVRRYLDRFESSPTLQTLSSLPFYCVQIADHLDEGRERDFNGELDFLDFTIEAMLDRELKSKKLIDFTLFAKDGLEMWLQEMARSYVESGFSGIEVAECDEYAQLVLRDGLSGDQLRSTLLGLRTFPLFEASETQGRLRFTHELIAEALAARLYARETPRMARDLALSLARRGDAERDQLIGFIAESLPADAPRVIANTLRDGGLSGAPFACLLGLLLRVRPDADLIKKAMLKLEGLELRKVRFEGRDLEGLSFRRCDLTGAEFARSNLRRVHFEGALLDGTAFVDCDLRDATFGDRSRVESLSDGWRRFEDGRAIEQWLFHATGIDVLRTDPCPNAQQVRFLFRKFVRPTGEQRKGRDDLPRKALLRGKRFPGAESLEDCVSAAVSAGFLVEGQRDRLRRAEGDRLEEMAQLVTDDRISDGIARLIARLCRRPNCRHRLT